MTSEARAYPGGCRRWHRLRRQSRRANILINNNILSLTASRLLFVKRKEQNVGNSSIARGNAKRERGLAISELTAIFTSISSSRITNQASREKKVPSEENRCSIGGLSKILKRTPEQARRRNPETALRKRSPSYRGVCAHVSFAAPRPINAA